MENKKCCVKCEWWLQNGDGSSRDCTICNNNGDDDDDDSLSQALRLSQIGDVQNGNGSSRDGNSLPQPIRLPQIGGDVNFPEDNDAAVDCEFPNDDDADDDEILTAIPWREVILKKWYRIIGSLHVKTTNGPATI